LRSPRCCPDLPDIGAMPPDPGGINCRDFNPL
jgi:hypothetical protein